MPRSVISAAELARILGVSPDLVYRRARQGRVSRARAAIGLGTPRYRYWLFHPHSKLLPSPGRRHRPHRPDAYACAEE